ncbi:hypothetical protein MKJ04_16160 [Pontibacter sp. E15-1]|uniref:hypothetical protein n=1 Tax=Pontibacter sp. E15-1 TaxID=2919918 RepID=UPI001F4F1E28|nr:hypothetical protein [Pontibacter sp. E15-1]MCJ8166381.1 hypothetical protein [Pontibacter sp. E15-1]
MEAANLKHFGVDYGAKLAGTTAVAMLHQAQLQVWQCQKGQDADSWLLQLTADLQPKIMYMDAPLTLPGVYSQTPYAVSSDFFYRQADRELGAMSPMFIGGLTARAIKLRVQLAEKGVGLLETYPAALAKLLLQLPEGYKKSLATLPTCVESLQGLLPFPLKERPQNWHQFDAILAWLSGYRHVMGQSVLYGDAKEGRIIV